jgi:transketolase
MRTAFIETLCELAAADPRIWLVTGDLGYSVLERFQERFPDRYINVGVAEQNMTGVAAGLALTGQIPFTYSIANFPTMRCLEQIRNDICHHQLPVRVVAVGGGFAYGPAGYTHHGVEDLAVMRSLIGMTVLAPGDPHETRLATRALLTFPGPAYLRLGKANEPNVHAVPPAFQIGRAIQLRDGHDVTLIATGGLLQYAVRSAERLEGEHHISCRVLSMPTVKPLDQDQVRKAARTTRLIVTVEEHSVTGSLGSAVAEVLAEMSAPRALLKRYGIPDKAYHLIGDQEYLRLQIAGDLTELASRIFIETKNR